MVERKGMFISFPDDFSLEERELIEEAFRMGNTGAIETKGFKKFLDFILAIPELVVVTFVSSAIATGFFEKLGGDIYDAVKKKLAQGFSKRLNAKLQFKIILSNSELTVEIGVKRLDHFDFVVKNITELIRKYELEGLTKGYSEAGYRVSDDNQWEKIPAGRDADQKEFKSGFRFQNHRNSFIFPQDEANYEHEYKIFQQKAIINNPFRTTIIDIHDKKEYEKMLALREKVYIEELGWIDKEDLSYDNDHAVFIVVYDAEQNHAGSLRILKPETPWMIEKEFKDLLNGLEINKTGAIEITRLAISTENRHRLASIQASIRLFQGLFHWLASNQFSTLYMVVRPQYFKFFEIEGFCPERLGIRIPEFDGVAGKISLDVTMPYLKENRYDLWDWITENKI